MNIFKSHNLKNISPDKISLSESVRIRFNDWQEKPLTYAEFSERIKASVEEVKRERPFLTDNDIKVSVREDEDFDEFYVHFSWTREENDEEFADRMKNNEQALVEKKENLVKFVNENKDLLLEVLKEQEII